MDTFQEELNEAANTIEKDMILQKYGVIAPKLTPEEKQEIANEERGFTHYV
jgi:hypothetical protein